MKITIYVLIILFFISCSQKTDIKYEIPQKLDDGLSISSTLAEGLDTTIFNNILKQISNNEYSGVQSILVFVNNKLVYENYFGKYSQNDLHPDFSVNKSILSLLIGIAIEKYKGFSVNDKLIKYFPEYKNYLIADSLRAEITVEHCLDMTTGIEWNEVGISFDDKRNDFGNMNESDDKFKYIFQKPMKSIPGKVFNYNTGNVVLLKEILVRVSGQNLSDFAYQNLFKPLRIEEFKWNDRNLELLPRDLGKFGILFLNNGNWNGEQIVPISWFEECMKLKIQFPDYFKQNHETNYYGNLWYKSKNKYGTDTYFAHGTKGQYLIIAPELNMVVIQNSDYENIGRETIRLLPSSLFLRTHPKYIENTLNTYNGLVKDSTDYNIYDLTELANDLVLYGEFEKANEIYNIIFQKYTDVFYETYLNYGISLLANHETEKAEIFLTKSIDLNPKVSTFDIVRLNKAKQILKEI
jgi:CubicO group peptidase (beta-lactamase class C family)